MSSGRHWHHQRSSVLSIVKPLNGFFMKRRMRGDVWLPGMPILDKRGHARNLYEKSLKNL